MPFRNGILLTLMTPGEATVIASLNGVEYSYPVSVAPLRHCTSEDATEYFVGDMHDHTTTEHNHERFIERTEGFSVDMLKTMIADGGLDFAVISDHSDSSNQRDFFRGFTDDLITEPKDLIVFPGSESEVNLMEVDRYGVPHKNAGEIVTLNADNMANVPTWEDFFDALAHSPFAFGILVHPQPVGNSRSGIWNFCLDRFRSEKHRRFIRLVEMGDGSDRHANLINEYVYSIALDNGFRVSPTCSSDAHGPEYGYHRFPGKTVIMASEKSKEAFYDAVLSNRVYASMSGNVKLRYSVNGCVAPATLPLAETYHFHIELSYFHHDPATRPIKLQVISNEGKSVMELENFGETVDFTVTASDAVYFYLRLWDEEGRKTWSCPVWTGREPLSAPRYSYRPLEKNGFTAIDEISGDDATILLNDDPRQFWTSQETQCSILIDMKQEYLVSGLSHFPQILTQKAIKLEGLTPPDKLCAFPSKYRISTSVDGKQFEIAAGGLFRVFGGEELIRFDPRQARYLRLEVLSSVGRASERKSFFNSKIVMAELTPYTI